MNNPVFAGLHDETDPLVGDLSTCSREFTIQNTSLRRRVHGLHPFVTLRGGAYFFLPGVRAIEYLASDRGA